ncbi:MAG: hypothetical protein ACLP59_07665, partial [Bryobacteraceae bacterium]
MLLFLPLLLGQSDDVRAVLTHSEEAWNRGDLVAFASFYEDSPETTFIHPRHREPRLGGLPDDRPGAAGMDSWAGHGRRNKRAAGPVYRN